MPASQRNMMQKLKEKGKDYFSRFPPAWREPIVRWARRRRYDPEALPETAADLLPNAKENISYRDYGNTRPFLAFDYLKGLVEWLAQSDYHVMSYRDLAMPLKKGEENQEFGQWIEKAQKKNQKAILLQYDVDANPRMTEAMLDIHMKCGIPANVMIFKEKIFDFKLKREGVLEIDSNYELNFKKLEAFQKKGGVIGYHCNAFDRARGHLPQALEIFAGDITALRKHLDIRFFSMHGGYVTPDGQCNATMQVEGLMKELGLTWVHNGNSVYFHSNWADGSASNPQYRRESNDPLDFILSTQAGERTRLIFHPQYYCDFENRNFHFPVLQDQRWVKEAAREVQKSRLNGKTFWARRFKEADQSVRQWQKFYEKPIDEKPVLIHGMSRSGTTLLVSLFDAHPQGAMSYESYPRYLFTPSGDGVLSREDFIYTYQTLIQYDEKRVFELLDRDPLRHLRTFAAVAGWSGLTTAQTGELLRAYLVKHGRIAEMQQALEVVAASARYKQFSEKADFWGTKCQGNFKDYLEKWPKAKFIYILRNGLDIFASQKRHGSFNPEAKDLGKRWAQNHLQFKQFQTQYPEATTALLRYEDLVHDPENVMKRLCKTIGLPYHARMIRQHEIETTLTRNPRGQLSAQRVQQPIDKQSVGNWRSHLSQEEVKAFLDGCGGSKAFESLGYDVKG